MPLAPRRSVCVFCGSRPGNDPAYAAAATDLGPRSPGPASASSTAPATSG